MPAPPRTGTTHAGLLPGCGAMRSGSGHSPTQLRRSRRRCVGDRGRHAVADAVTSSRRRSSCRSATRPDRGPSVPRGTPEPKRESDPSGGWDSRGGATQLRDEESPGLSWAGEGDSNYQATTGGRAHETSPAASSRRIGSDGIEAKELGLRVVPPRIQRDADRSPLRGDEPWLAGRFRRRRAG